MMSISFVKCDFGDTADKKCTEYQHLPCSLWLILCCNRDTISLWGRQWAGTGVKVKHFSSATVIGLIVSPKQISIGSCFIVPLITLLWQYLLCPLVLQCFIWVILFQHMQVVSVKWCETWF